ncbi:unnamed protein product [Allacma fusca]|uniref:CN hydrolase domain-containing protein n=1 Tax=Allacma fusca TaxID=39272 RepID=A0A8J2J0B6_9HEXA|nr:unnamed protein product [Allacma fusca]
MKLFLLFVICFFQVYKIQTCCASLGTSDSVKDKKLLDFYTAAVVEYAADEGTENLNPEQILWKNVENYGRIMAQAAEEENVDIIVFPENGLTSALFSSLKKNITFAPLLQKIPEVGVNPCRRDELLIVVQSEVIQHLSCSAKANRMYLVVNLGETVSTSNNEISEGETRDLRYNTAVVFDRDGTIVAKYRKYNLFAEPQFDAPEIPELSTFTTDFGVTFGVFICFDLLFEQPAKQLVANEITHFVFPTSWIDELPFLTAIQAQMFWASSSKATLLASGYHNPEFGKMGSGIYLPSGQPLNYTFNPDSGTQVVYAKVPKIPERATTKSTIVNTNVHKNMESLFAMHFYYRENLGNYTGVTLPMTPGENKISACDNEFCCEVQYTYIDSHSVGTSLPEEMKTATHKLIVFNQQRKFSSPSVVRLMGLQICSVVRCLNDTMESCAEYSTKPDHDLLPGFEAIQLSASPFKVFQHSQPGFTTLDTTLEVIPLELFEQKLEEERRDYSVKSNSIKEFQIQTIALFNRVFSSEE